MDCLIVQGHFLHHYLEFVVIFCPFWWHFCHKPMLISDTARHHAEYAELLLNTLFLSGYQVFFCSFFFLSVE